MADQISGGDGNHGVVLEMIDTSGAKEEKKSTLLFFLHSKGHLCSLLLLLFFPPISSFLFSFRPFCIHSDVVGTYFLIFNGCKSVAVNLDYDKVVTLLGISIVWGLAVMVLVYSVGHVSGAHFNPAVAIAFATYKRFPWKQVPPYIVAQVFGSTMASRMLRLLFIGKLNPFVGTQPAAFVFEFIITFYLMFNISGVAIDSRAMSCNFLELLIRELAGLVVGATVLLNVMFAGPVTGASMNPARSLGPAIAFGHYDKLWSYIVAPTVEAISGAWVYNVI
ncbi:hypothetical protein BT93_E1937 [Corymbia citriodora subsp. variegata]|nr:hypothetical protein BT93_E1937 [Corymbia citriodora subsp. variegata]